MLWCVSSMQDARMLNVNIIYVLQLQWDGSWGGRHHVRAFINPAEKQEASGIVIELMNNLRV